MRIKPKWISLALSMLGVGGVGLTSYLSVKCHDKSKDKTEKKEKILAYAPAIASGVGTAACILGSHGISRKEIAAITAGCAYVTADRDRIVKKIQDTFGHEEARKIVSESVSVGLPDHDISIERTGRGNDLFKDCYSGRFFRSSYANVVKGIRILNETYVNGTSVCFNTLYDLWNILPTDMGDRFGWPFWDEEFVWNENMTVTEKSITVREPIRFDIVKKDQDPEGNNIYYIILDEDSWPREDWAEY